MTESTKNESLGLGLLNGVVLSLIGALVLITPLLPSAELTGRERMLDNVAGGMLLGVGLLLLVLHFTKRKASDQESE